MEDNQEIPQDYYTKLEAKDEGLLKWFLDTKKDIEDLKHLWRGYEQDYKGLWYKPQDKEERRLMNEMGIHWCVSILKGYLGKSYQYTNLDKEHMNYLMRKAYRTVWFGLLFQFKKFNINKVNCQGIANSMLSMIHTILLSSRAQGLREFLGKTHTVSEVRQMNMPENRGWFSGIRSILSGRSGT